MGEHAVPGVDADLVAEQTGCRWLQVERELRAPIGHPPVMVRSPAVSGAPTTVRLLGDPALPMGVVDEPPGDVVQCRLEPGESLVLYSDGLTESALPRGGLLDVDGLRDVVARAPAPASDAVAFVLEEVERLSVQRPAEDDRTVLVLRRLP